jgi:hypothetical protein
MTMARYFVELLNVFMKWWWAIITGVASILSWLAIPEGLTLSRTQVSVSIFVSSVLILLTISVFVKGYSWYLGSTQHPRVIKFIPARGGSSAASSSGTFVIRELGWKMLPGDLYSLYRNVREEEVCIALIKVDRMRHGDGSVQCIPLWISAGHLTELNGDGSLAVELSVRREIPERVVNMVKIKA